PTGEILDRLPSPGYQGKDRWKRAVSKDEQKRIAALRNPTVIRIQNELRKVVNNLIGLYGKPDRIRIELAREVGKSKRDREKMQANTRRNSKRHQDAIADLQSKGIAQPSRDSTEKWLLWEECGHFVPYSNSPIDFGALFLRNEFD